MRYHVGCERCSAVADVRRAWYISLRSIRNEEMRVGPPLKAVINKGRVCFYIYLSPAASARVNESWLRLWSEPGLEVK